MNEPKAESYATCAIPTSFFEKIVNCPNENTNWVAHMDYAPFCVKWWTKKVAHYLLNLLASDKTLGWEMMSFPN